MAFVQKYKKEKRARMVFIIMLMLFLSGCAAEKGGVDSSGRMAKKEWEIDFFDKKAKAVLLQGDCLEALDILAEGIKRTDAEVLKKEYKKLQKEIILVKSEYYDSSGLLSSDEYDKDGKFLRRTYYTNSGEERGWAEYQYDEKGNGITEASYNNNELLKKTENQYDASGRLSKEILYNKEDEIIFCREYQYDKWGNKSKEIGFVPDGSYAYGIEQQYNEAGNVIKRIIQDKEGTTGETIYQYNQNGDCIEELQYGREGSLEIWHQKEYNTMGNLSRENYLREDGTLWYWIEYKYNEEGKCLTKTVYDENSRLYKKELYQYDKEGNLTYQVTYDKTLTIDHSTVYVYDKMGNCILRNDNNYTCGNVNKTTTRIIEYDRMGNIIYDIHKISQADMEFLQKQEYHYNYIWIGQ